MSGIGDRTRIGTPETGEAGATAASAVAPTATIEIDNDAHDARTVLRQ
ncbi:hypothetical protein [Halopiger xanaduensis]|nr:hypothetical protein [Halopiger xanaduensis]